MLQSIRKLLSLPFDKYMKLQVWLCCKLICIPYYVRDNILQTVKSGPRRLIHRMQIISHAIYLAAMILFMSSKAIQGYRMQTKELTGVVFISLNLLCFLCRFNFMVYDEEGAKLVNMVWKFSENKDWVRMEMPLYVNFVYIIGTATGILFPGLILSLLLIEPCTPPYITSIFLCSSSSSDTGTTLETIPYYFIITAITLDCFMWCHIPGPVALYLGNFFYCFTVFINLVLKMSSTVEQQRSIKTYKCMQILTSQLNETFSHLLPLVLTTVSSILIFTLFICIRLSSEPHGFGFLIFPLTAVDCILIILVEFSSAGFVNSNSTAYTKSLINKYNNNRSSSNCLRQPLRIALSLGSSSSWVQKVTPLVVLDFCISQTAALLLVM